MDEALRTLRPMRIGQDTLDRTIIHSYSDAAVDDVVGLSRKLSQGIREGLEEHNIHIGGILLLPNEAPMAFTCKLTKLPKFVTRIHIGVLELVAVKVAQEIFSTYLHNKLVIAHVDNLGDVFGLAANSIRCDISQRISLAFHKYNYENDFCFYITWICSSRNVADVLTREKRSKILREAFPDARVRVLGEDFVCSQGSYWGYNPN